MPFKIFKRLEWSLTYEGVDTVKRITKGFWGTRILIAVRSHYHLILKHCVGGTWEELKLHLWKNWVITRNMAQEGNGKEIPYLSLFPTFNHGWFLPMEASWQGIWAIHIGVSLLWQGVRPQKMENGSRNKGKQKITRKPVFKEFFF